MLNSGTGASWGRFRPSSDFYPRWSDDPCRLNSSSSPGDGWVAAAQHRHER